MDTYKSDDEQVETLKKWWRENGMSTVASVLIAGAAVFAWNSWQDNQQARLDGGSAAYQELLQALAAAEASPDDIKIATADHLAQTLKDEHGGSGYAHFAALFKAQQAVNDDDLAAAEQELRWVLADKPSAEMRLLASLRLARVLYAQGQVDDALAIVARTDTGAFAPAYLEVKGDMLIDQGDYQGAVDAYTLAQRKAKALELPEPQMLTAKLGYARSFL